jgi:pimeloyl-ACP methyl ester carboxylesterase
MANVVLIHGSWHGAWCWYKVAPRLEAAGHRVLVPDLPAHGRSWSAVRGLVTLGQMVRTLTDLLDRLDEPAVVVAHSRGGIVASRVAELRSRKVAKLVYLASFMLRDGERVADYFFRDKGSLLHGNVAIDRLRASDMVDRGVCAEALYADCSPEDQALALSLLTPEPSLPALTRVRLSEDNYGTVERHYIELTQDRAVTPELQRAFVERSPCKQVVSLAASHSAYFSMPDELAGAIGRIACS